MSLGLDQGKLAGSAGLNHLPEPPGPPSTSFRGLCILLWWEPQRAGHSRVRPSPALPWLGVWGSVSLSVGWGGVVR